MIKVQKTMDSIHFAVLILNLSNVSNRQHYITIRSKVYSFMCVSWVTSTLLYIVMHLSPRTHTEEQELRMRCSFAVAALGFH